MLKGIDPILTPDLLWLMASMGHGDDLAVVDANHPADRIARASITGRLIRLPGLQLPRVIGAILRFLPLDKSEPDPIRVMINAREPDKAPEIHGAVLREINRGSDQTVAFGEIERFAFYDSAKRSFGVVQRARTPIGKALTASFNGS